MNNKLLIILFLITNLVIIASKAVSTLFIARHIAYHSTHPTHGNFDTASVEGRPCMPWDSCR